MDVGQMTRNQVMAIVGIIVILLIVAGLATPILGALGNLSTSGLPLASMFSTTGVVGTIVMVGILIAVLALAFKKNHK